jgi:hypothetical protein
LADSYSELIRAGRKVLRMVGELHLRGYQRLRISPGVSSSGSYWRCSVTPASNVSPDNGALMVEWRECDAHYSSADGRRYFGWTDMAHATASELADRFLQEFPAIARAGHGRDWLYAGWYVEMLHITYPDVLPEAYADYVDSTLRIPCGGQRKGVFVPAPPPGHGVTSG